MSNGEPTNHSTHPADPAFRDRGLLRSRMGVRVGSVVYLLVGSDRGGEFVERGGDA